jgi:very-short-patch-repair endonuclease
MNKMPQPLSVGEETFADHCKAYGLWPVREFAFATEIGRNWLFDFAWPKEKIAVEVEGGTKHGFSRHSRGNGFEKDCRKYNAAAMLGWRLFRFTTKMVMSGEAIDKMREVLGR